MCTLQPRLRAMPRPELPTRRLPKNAPTLAAGLIWLGALEALTRPSSWLTLPLQAERLNAMAVNLNDLSAGKFRNESDVEQKLIYPLLVAEEWLGIDPAAVHTKTYLPPATIDKGSGRRVGYYPDYSVWLRGFPVFIIEAKSPIEGVEEGFREAQLYAHEVNKSYPSGVSPIQTVACINGKKIRIGSLDGNDAVDYDVSSLQLASGTRSALVELVGCDALETQATRTLKQFRPTHSFRPINFAGGDTALNRPIDLNSFATDIAPLVRMFFVSESAERIDDIIRYAYVSSEETTKYDVILESFLRDNIQGAI